MAQQRAAFRVDRVLVTQELVMKSFGNLLRRVRNVAGASILGDGQLLMILNLADLSTEYPSSRENQTQPRGVGRAHPSLSLRFIDE